MRFESFDFAPEILRAVSDCGYQEMTPVQQQAIPAIRRGRDVLASAQTGTGKTAAFALPILQRLVDNPAPVQPSNARVLILTPTRELAAQVASNINDFAKYLDITTITIVGGGKQDVQAKKLKAGAHIIVATPGRLLEHLTACNLSLSGVECLVMDEADRILDMGFSADVQKILQAVNKTRSKPALLRHLLRRCEEAGQPDAGQTTDRQASTSRTPPPTPSATPSIRSNRSASASCSPS